MLFGTPVLLALTRKRIRPVQPGVYSRSAAVSAIVGLPVAIATLVAAIIGENPVAIVVTAALALAIWIFLLTVAARGVRSGPPTQEPTPTTGNSPPRGGSGPTTLEILPQIAGIVSLVVAIIALVAD